MSAAAKTFGDSAIMLRRNFKHTARNPVTVFNAILFPVVMMLMFVYIFGGAFKVSGAYVDYAVPGLTVMAIHYGMAPTAAAVNGDMTTGVINRFKAMDVARGAVLAGHVVATTVRSLIADAAIIGVGFAIGFRPHADLLQWLAAIGIMTLLAFAVTWLTVAVGLAAKSAESAGLATVPLIMLPFLSSAFVPADTMKTGVRQFAEYQPFTPIIESIRGFLSGHPSASHTTSAVAWCVGFIVVGYVWSVSTFNKRA